MTVTAVALLLISVGFVIYEVVTVQQRMRREVATQGSTVGDLSAAAISHNNVSDAEKILATLAYREHVTAAAIYKGGKLFAQYPATAGATGFPATPQSGNDSQIDFKAGTLVAYHEINASGKPLGSVYIKSDLHEIKDQLERYAAFFIWFILATAGITYFLSKRLQKSISEPIVQLAKTARTVSAEKNYSLRAAKQGAPNSASCG